LITTLFLTHNSENKEYSQEKLFSGSISEKYAGAQVNSINISIVEPRDYSSVNSEVHPVSTLASHETDTQAKFSEIPQKRPEIKKALRTQPSLATSPVTTPIPAISPPPSQTSQSQPRTTKSSSSDVSGKNFDNTESPTPAGNLIATTATEYANAQDSSFIDYRKKVFEKIAKVRKHKVMGEGKVVIGFSVTDNGEVIDLHVAQTSGSSSIDKAGLAHVRRAIPLPQPPVGAERRFTIPLDYRL
jgi:TonB family protein